MNQMDHPGQLADFVTYSPTFTFAARIAILNALDIGGHEGLVRAGHRLESILSNPS